MTRYRVTTAIEVKGIHHFSRNDMKNELINKQKRLQSDSDFSMRVSRVRQGKENAGNESLSPATRFHSEHGLYNCPMVLDD